MFERYTERARRSIFFARYEASVFGTQEITSEELLLGILREDKSIATRLGAGAAEAIRKEIEARAPAKGERVSTSMDLPLSQESQRSLAYAAEEAAALESQTHFTPAPVARIAARGNQPGSEALGETRHDARAGSRDCRASATRSNVFRASGAFRAV